MQSSFRPERNGVEKSISVRFAIINLLGNKAVLLVKTLHFIQNAASKTNCHPERSEGS